MQPKKPTLCLFGALALGLLLPVAQARAGLNVNVNLNAPPPPAYVFQAPPQVVPVPGTYVYYVPGVSTEVLFYQGSWYRPHGGGWYKARSYDGPWVYVAPPHVPHAVVALPPGYRARWRGEERIPYGQLKKNWARWERERHWEGRREWHDRGPDNDRDRGRGPEGRGDDRDRGPGHGGQGWGHR